MMLAVFDKAVAKGSEALQRLNTDSAPFSALKDGSFAKYFNFVQPDSLSLNFGSSGFIFCSSNKQVPLLPGTEVFILPTTLCETSMGSLHSYCMTEPPSLFAAGMHSDNNLVISDDEVLVKKACGKSFAPYPKDNVGYKTYYEFRAGQWRYFYG